MVLNKKAISPVVATALLLVVAVVAVVGFQSWFQTYNSGLTADVEQRSANTEGIGVELLELGDGTTLENNVTVFLKNAGAATVTNVEIKVGTCSDTWNITTGTNNYTVGGTSDCTLVDGATAEVTLITSDGVYREKEIVR